MLFRSRNGNQVVYQVFGTNAYTTKIDLIGDLIASTTCDCPYDQGPVCKHIVTALYDLRERQIDENKTGISDVEQLIKNLPDSVVREEFLSLLNTNPEYQQKVLLKYGQLKAENINELVINAFYAAEIECDKFGFCELSDFSGILEDILRNLEKKHSLPEMVLFVKEIIKEVENIFEREYGHTVGLYENDTFYLTEFADTYFDEYSSKKNVNGIKDIVDSYVQDFYEEVDYHNSSIPTHVLYTLERLNYDDNARNKMNDIILDIKNNAKKYLSYSISDFLFKPSEELEEYKKKALNQNSILLSLDHYLYSQAVNNDNDDQIKKIMNRNFLIDFYFYKQKTYTLMAAKKYKEVELLLMGDFNNYMHSSHVKSLKEDLYKRTNRSDDLREMYITELYQRFTMNTYLHFKELSNEVEFKRLLKEIVDKYLGDRYVPKDLIHILIMEELESLIIKLISKIGRAHV